MARLRGKVWRLAGGALCCGIAGCGAAEQSEVADITYLLTPAAPSESGRLMPDAPGATWNLTGTVETNRESLPAEAVVTAEKALTVGNARGTLYSTRLNGRVIRSEVLSSDAQNLLWLGSGNGAAVKLQFSPPLPRLRLPLPAPTIAPIWVGRLLANGKSLPATAVCRMSGPDYVKTPAGAFAAYRSDVKLTVPSGTDGAEAKTIYSMLWFAPGVGVVKEVFLQNGQSVFLELKQHKPAPQ